MRHLLTSALLLLLTVTLFAQAPAAPPAPGPCESEERINLYTEYYNNKSKDAAAQRRAYEVGKQFVEKYAAACPDKYTDAIQKFIKAYEEATERYNLAVVSYGPKADYEKAFEIGRHMLAGSPDDLSTLITLAHAGDAALAAKNDAYVAESLAAAKKAIEQIEAGKAPASWTPYKSRDEALSYLAYHAGNLAIANHDPAGAVLYLIKAATVEGPSKSEPLTYGRLAVAYQQAQLDAMQKDYNDRFSGKPETPEGKWALDQVNQVIDRIIDAYARAVNLSGDKAEYAPAKAAWNQTLTAYYKFRVNDALTGYDDFIKDAATRPLPAPFEAKPYVPEPAPPKRK